MRLINAETFKLDFFLEKPPPYAILSHTWEGEEVTFQDMEKGVEHASQMQGFAKIRGCCTQALLDGYCWAWVDTCCIDKTSSTELSEAINSMYQWYKSSAVCYVYMSDVAVGSGRPGRSRSPPTAGATTSSGVSASPDLREQLSKLMGGMAIGGRPALLPPIPSFHRSRWFQRGWTLQELIAPRLVVFYDAEWSEIGTKSSMALELRRITGVRREVLCGQDPPSICTVGERMSWASSRQTTRVEDRAYSLLGIFDVNMPLLYGEGKRAFIRLQEEILRRNEDLSLLAWTNPGLHDRSVGVLVDNPGGFTSVLFTDNPPLVQDADNQDRVRQGFTWQDVKTVRPDDVGAEMNTVGFSNKPPDITSRGILVTLLVRSPSDLGIPGHDDDLVAWVFLKTHFLRDKNNDNVCFCVMIRPTAPKDQWFNESIAGFLVASRAVSGRARGLVCVPESVLKAFTPRKVYLSYAFPQPEARTKWAQYNLGNPIMLDRIPSSHEVHQNYNALHIHVHPEERLKVTSHYPTSPFLVDHSNGRYELRIPRPAASGDSLTDGFGQVSLFCNYQGDHGWSSLGQRFVVDFTTFCLGSSRHFHCEVYKYQGSKLKIGKSTPPIDTFWGYNPVQDPALRPVDRAYLSLEDGHMVLAAIKEHVSCVRDDSRVVNVTLSLSVTQ